MSRMQPSFLARVGPGTMLLEPSAVLDVKEDITYRATAAVSEYRTLHYENILYIK